VSKIISVNLRYRKAIAAEVPGEFKKRHIFFPHVIQNANCAVIAAFKPDDRAPRASKLPLQRLHALHRRMEMPPEKTFKHFNRHSFQTMQRTNPAVSKDNTR